MWRLIERDRPEVVAVDPERRAFSVARRPSWRKLERSVLTGADAAGARCMALRMRVAGCQ
ncbi:unnamed protein product, partial [Prorocentrum cordatum]